MFLQRTNHVCKSRLITQAAWRLEPTETSTETDIVNYNLVKNTNSDIMRLTNTGKYPCKVELGFEKREEDIKDVFLVEPFEVNLEEGETKEVKIWAFPPVPSQRYQNTLVACVSNNPRPLRFNMECSGVEPSIVLKGPWLEALAEAEAAAAAFVLVILAIQSPILNLTLTPILTLVLTLILPPPYGRTRRTKRLPVSWRS